MNYPSELMEIEEWQRFGLPAQRHYSDEMSYHNWDHAEESVIDVVELGKRCERRGIELNIGQLVTAAAWHDAGFHRNHIAFGYTTKEEYSADLAGDFLKSQKAEMSFMTTIQDIILGTKHNVGRPGLHALVMHRADVANIGKPYDIFATKCLLLLSEKRLEEPSLTFRGWQLALPSFIDFTIEEALRELPQIGEPVETADSFDVVAAQNRDRFVKELNEAELTEKLGMVA